MFVSATRMRIRSLPAYLAFFRANNRVVAQVTASEGFLGGSLIIDRLRTFWTGTAWESEAAMRIFRNSGVHRHVMPRLITWCDEAATVHWQADALPTVAELEARMLSEPKFFKVAQPSPDQQAQRIRPMSRLRLVGPLTPAAKTTALATA